MARSAYKVVASYCTCPYIHMGRDSVLLQPWLSITQEPLDPMQLTSAQAMPLDMGHCHWRGTASTLRWLCFFSLLLIKPAESATVANADRKALAANPEPHPIQDVIRLLKGLSAKVNSWANQELHPSSLDSSPLAEHPGMKPWSPVTHRAIMNVWLTVGGGIPNRDPLNSGPLESHVFMKSLDSEGRPRSQNVLSKCAVCDVTKTLALRSHAHASESLAW